MTIFLFLTGLLLSAILISFNARRYPSAVYLGLFFFLVSLYAIIYEIMVYSKSVFLISIVYQNFGFPTYLIGPALYLYIRSVLSDNSSLRKWDILHLIPALLFLIAVLPYTFTPYAHKLEIARQIAGNERGMAFIKPTLIYRFLSAEFIYQSRPVHLLIYTLWSMAMVGHYFWRRQSSMVMKHQRYMIRWLIVLLSFTLIMVLAHMIQVHLAFALPTRFFYTLSLIHLFAGVGFAGLNISPFFFPGILYGMPRFRQPAAPVNRTTVSLPDQMPAVPETNTHSTEALPKDSAAPSFVEQGAGTAGLGVQEKPKPPPAFESDYLAAIRFKVMRCMEEDKPYLHQECNVAFLSKLINIPAHHLAYFFREEMRQPFNEFRNQWRVGYAKNMIRNGKAREMTLEAIGLASGFSSRITFINAFKKTEGIPPGVYASGNHQDPV